ncbi:MAG: malonyl-CoA synthase [Mesorhizobium sp.]|uniref:malonate--CoA ligase n=1 Tax=Mesorhizobium sp. TaxID=1871066 RepID=UPI00120BF166|nr:malonyl-CoA synthase [Mesorhizobium sp.]TIQ39108.1 MAG: malonyl-CoA synthase [Mesorhizobium sp.]
MSNLFGAFRLTDRAERVALVLQKDTNVTYADLATLAGRIARRLDDIGVAPGDRIVVQVDKSHFALALFLACLQRGAVFVPLNTGYTLQEVSYFIEDAQPKLVVCHPERLGAITTAAVSLDTTAVTLDSDGSGSLTDRLSTPTFDVVSRDPDDLAAILYTSGTTGRPKGAMLSHANLSSNAHVLKDLWRFTHEDLLLHALPIYHAHGLFVACNVLLLAGGRMIFLPKFEIENVLEALPKATTMMGIPTFYTRLLAEDRLTPDLVRHMRLFTSGSAPLLAETHIAWQRRTGHVLLERYGMTETGMITSNPYDGDRIAGTVGIALPGTELRVVDHESGSELPRGKIGMIEVRGDNVFKGYWRLPEKTATEFKGDAFFITGDLGTIDNRGYVRIVGRGKDLIISGGLNVYPKEVETEIDSLDGVVESAVFGVPHPDFGEAVTAVVVTEKDFSISQAEMLKVLASRLAKFKLPKHILVVPELPRNAMGKVQKAELRQQYRGLHG